VLSVRAAGSVSPAVGPDRGRFAGRTERIRQRRRTGVHVAPTDGQQVGDHRLTGGHRGGEDGHGLLGVAGLHHPLGHREVLEDRIADLEGLGLATGLFGQGALFLDDGDGAELSHLDLVGGMAEECTEEQQARAPRQPPGDVDVTGTVGHLDHREQCEADGGSDEAAPEAEGHGKERDRECVEDVDGLTGAV